MSPENLVTALRETLDERFDGLPVRLPTPEQLDGRLRAVRRRRLRHRVLPATAITAVLAVGAAAATGTDPIHLLRRDQAATSAAPAPSRPSPLAGQPTRGSLSGDRSFVDRLRRAVLPAGPLQNVALAWSTSATEHGFVGLLGPAGAVTAEITDRAGHRTSVRLTDGTGSTNLTTRDEVTFLDAAGHRLATVPVIRTDAPLRAPNGS